MDFAYTDKVQKLQAQVSAFMDRHIYPNEARFFAEIEENRRKGNPWVPTRIIEELKRSRARKEGCGTCGGPRSTAARSPTSSTRRCARSWGG